MYITKMTVKDLKDIVNAIPQEKDNVEIVGEVCFGKHHGFQLCHAGLGQENKFVLFFKEREDA